MDSKRLWAKSCKRPEDFIKSMHFQQHLDDVRDAAQRVLDSTARDQLTALGLDVGTYEPRLRRCVLLAAAVHDLGKANDHFQGMLLCAASRKGKPQGFRHEWATLLMLQHLQDWLLPAVCRSETDFGIVEWAVTGHHPAHNHASPPKGPPPEGGAGAVLTLQMGHADFSSALTWLGTAFELGVPPTVTDEYCDLSVIGTTFKWFTTWAKEAQCVWRNWGTQERRFVAAVKNTLVAADVAGSALPREGSCDPWQRITDSFANKP
jgi:CRISPR-associated endonuclease/helicase Cas3